MNIPTTAKELAESLGQKQDRLEKKMLDMNGVVNYDPSCPILEPWQVAAVAKKYLSGTRPLQGENRKRALELIELAEPVKEIEKEPVQKPVRQKRQKLVQPVQELVKEPEKEPVQPDIKQSINQSFLKTGWFSGLALLGCLIVQVRHFGLYYAVLQKSPNDLRVFALGCLFGVLAESFGLVQAVNSGKRIWIIGIFAISCFINSLQSRFWLNETGADIFGGLLFNLLLPFCIMGYSLLYHEKIKTPSRSPIKTDQEGEVD